ncbi:MAG: aminoglycoside phosphotransferase family protein [bacterium]|nr:aminoglycoside phosphotransferase family protein [bacterium]
MPEPRRIPPPGIPPAEVTITDDLVAQLLEDQHPDLAGKDLRLFGSGWDNTTYRLGADLAVRMPRRQLGADMMGKELRWVSELALKLPLPVGAPLRVGRPALGYPWPWSIVEWIEGVSAEMTAPAPSEATRLGGFLRALHTSAPASAPVNPWRGGALADRAFSVEQRLERLRPEDITVPARRVAEVWEKAKAVPLGASEPVWLHGDLHPRNVIVRGERIEAVIDWGDLCVGDPATDVAAAWLLFPNGSHSQFRDAYGSIPSDTWERARGWAVFFGVVMVDAGRIDDDRWAECGRVALERACR